MKQTFDFFVSFILLIILSPILLVFIIIIWLSDFNSPFYVSSRVGKDNKPFKLIKLRSMIINADKTGIDSTSINDNRITKVGKLIRKFKLDELCQLFNVLLGQMSLVGPRPNVKREVDLYSDIEINLLNVKPGITDFSSIVFSDEGDILDGAENPDLRYNQLIRPWKSRLGLIYIKNSSILLDIKIILLTAVSIFAREISLNQICKVLEQLNVENNIIEICSRKKKLYPFPPPGYTDIVHDRTINK